MDGSNILKDNLCNARGSRRGTSVINVRGQVLDLSEVRAVVFETPVDIMVLFTNEPAQKLSFWMLKDVIKRKIMEFSEKIEAFSSLDKIYVEKRYRKFVIDDEHPCVMAQSLFEQNQVDFVLGAKMGGVDTTLMLYKRITAYLDNYDFNSNDFRSLIAVFPMDKFSSEMDFEKALWDQLQALHSIDNLLWDKEVSKDPNSSKFSFSIAGKAFYIVGMHPGSSRMARSAPYPTLVFNLHRQFEKLREMGAYPTIQKRIRKRDKALQGSINPILKDFGKDSEAKQYSGRKVSDSWQCPFVNEH